MGKLEGKIALVTGGKSGKPEQEPTATAIQSELAQAWTRIAELEQALESARAGTIHPSSEQQEEEWQFHRRKPSPDEKRILKLQARVRQLEALVLPLDDEQKDALSQYKRKVDRELKAHWKANETRLKQIERNIKTNSVTILRKDYNLFIAGFHPDASPEMRDKARNRFVGLYEKRVIADKDYHR